MRIASLLLFGLSLLAQPPAARIDIDWHVLPSAAGSEVQVSMKSFDAQANAYIVSASYEYGFAQFETIMRVIDRAAADRPDSASNTIASFQIPAAVSTVIVSRLQVWAITKRGMVAIPPEAFLCSSASRARSSNR